MKILRFLPLAAFIVLVSALSLQSCKKDDKAALAVDSTKTVPAAATTAPADSGKSVALNDKAKKGQTIFYNTSFGKAKIACATCHTDGSPKTQGTQIRQGHTLAGVTSRTATWNGMYKGEALQKAAYGASLCAAVFQHRTDIKNVDKALSADEVDAINEYLLAINAAPGAMTSNLKIQWAGKPTFSDDPPDEKVAKPAVKAIMKLAGDPAAGDKVFASSCGTCHSMNDKKIGPPMVKVAKDMNYVAQTVRFGSGSMAFYGKDVLSDQQVADAVAFIQSSIGK